MIGIIHITDHTILDFTIPLIILLPTTLLTTQIGMVAITEDFIILGAVDIILHTPTTAHTEIIIIVMPIIDAMQEVVIIDQDHMQDLLQEQV